MENIDMTQEEKELLVKDISARFQYGVKCQSDIHSSIVAYCTLEAIKRDIHGGFYFELTDRDADGTALASTSTNDLGMVKPYLRSMSTMTDEEKKEYRRKQNSILLNDEPGSRMFTYCDNYKSIDWLNEHYFDYRGLIGKGLALEASEEMYKKDGYVTQEEIQTLKEKQAMSAMFEGGYRIKDGTIQELCQLPLN